MEGFMKPTTDFPFLLDNPRAWRTYLGGRMLDALHGDSNGEDGHFPEEWILSTVAARNAGREQFPEEGMSHLRGTDVTLKSVLESEPEGYLGKGATQPTLGVLTKLIDSAAYCSSLALMRPYCSRITSVSSCRICFPS